MDTRLDGCGGLALDQKGNKKMIANCNVYNEAPGMQKQVCETFLCD